METELKILTLNCWGAPLAHAIDKRMKLIGKKIASGDNDIVVLIEVFYQKSLDTIFDTLSPIYGHSHYFYSGFIGSGIYVFSKYPLKDATYTPYRAFGSPLDRTGDYFSNKGIAFCKVMLPCGEIKLVTTHVHANYEHCNYKILRSMQLYQLACFIKIVSDGKTPVILTGDFNTEPEEIGMRYLLSATRFIDSCSYIHQDKSNMMYTFVGYGHVSEDKKERIDYILHNEFLQTSDFKICFKEMFEGVHLSDHLGIQATLKVVDINDQISTDENVSNEFYKKLVSASMKEFDPAFIGSLLLFIFLISLLLFKTTTTSPNIISISVLAVFFVSCGFALFALFLTIVHNTEQLQNYNSILAEIDLENKLINK